MFVSLSETTQTVTSLSLAGSDGELLPQFVSEAHSHVRKQEFMLLQLMPNPRVGC